MNLVFSGKTEENLLSRIGEIIASDAYSSDLFRSIVFGRSRQRMSDRDDVRKRLDETRDVMRNIVNSVNEKTDEGYIYAFSLMGALKEEMAELRSSFAGYSKSRLRTLAKDDKLDVDFILDEELADMQEFMIDARTLLEQCKKGEVSKTRKHLLDCASNQLNKVAGDFRQFSNKVIGFKQDVKNQSEESVRKREILHYTDIEHDVAEHADELRGLFKENETIKSKTLLDALSDIAGYSCDQVGAIRDSIRNSSYDDVYNEELDMLFGINKVLELVGTKRKSIFERFGALQRKRKHKLDAFPREELLATLDMLANQYFNINICCRTSAAEKKENTLFFVSFFSVVADGFKNLKNSVSNLYKMVSSVYKNCICSYDTFLDRIDELQRLSSKTLANLSSKQRKIYEPFTEMKNYIKSKLIEMKSSLLNFDFSAVR